MTQFLYLWDAQAELLAVQVEFDEATQIGGFGAQAKGYQYLLFVDGPLPAGGFGTIAVTPVRSCDSGIASTIVLPVPSEELATHRFSFRLEDLSNRGNGFVAQESITLESGVPGAVSETTKWSVHLFEVGPSLVILDETEEVQDGLISEVFTSRRSGETIYPAVRGDKLGIGLAIEVTTENDADSGSDFATHALLEGPKRLFLNRPNSQGGREIKIEAFSLIGGRHVLQILQDTSANIPQIWNRQSAKLRPKQPAELKFPMHQEAGQDVDSHLSYDLSLLDRVVIRSRPAAEFTFTGDDDISTNVGRAGTVAFVVNEKGDFVPDDGALIDRILSSEESLSAADSINFMEGLSTHRYNISPRDLEAGSDVMVFLYAAACLRIEDAFQGGAAALRPASFQSFSKKPQFYTTIAEIPQESLSRRSSQALRGTVDAGYEASYRALADQVLKKKIEDERRNEMVDEAHERLKKWVASGQGNVWSRWLAALSDDVCELIRNGIDPGETIVSPSDVAFELDDIEEFGELLGALEAAGIELMLGSDGFSNFDVYTDHLEMLETLQKAVADAFKEVFSEVNSEGEPNMSVDQILSEVRGISEIRKNRAAEYLREQLKDKLHAHGEHFGLSGFLSMAAARLYQEIAVDYAKVEKFISFGFPDPIELKDDNVVELRNEFAENQRSYVSDPTLAMKEWLLSDETSSQLVSKWRESLTTSYEWVHAKSPPKLGN